MKKLLATALTLALSVPTGAAFAETIKYSTKGTYASTGWHTSDNCAYSFLDVSAGDSATRQTGSGPVTSSYVGVYYSSSNWCTGEYQYQYGSAWGEGEVNVGPKAVTVQATLDSYDYMTGAVNTIEVDLTFVGNGEFTSRGVSNNMTTSGPVRTHYRSVGSTESADVSGTVTLNGTDLTGGATTPTWGWLSTSNNGTVEIVVPDVMH